MSVIKKPESDQYHRSVLSQAFLLGRKIRSIRDKRPVKVFPFVKLFSKNDTQLRDYTN